LDKPLGTLWREKPSIWAVSNTDTDQITGFLGRHPAAVFSHKGTNLGQGLRLTFADKKPSTKLGQALGQALARKTLHLGRFGRRYGPNRGFFGAGILQQSFLRRERSLGKPIG
jgi:hypothetical protein